MKTYKIVRMYMNPNKSPQEINDGLTLEEAQDWCEDPETSSRTCKHPNNVARTEKYGPWFDGYEEEA